LGAAAERRRPGGFPVKPWQRRVLDIVTTAAIGAWVVLITMHVLNDMACP
jgi:hypothetical protein